MQDPVLGPAFTPQDPPTLGLSWLKCAREELTPTHSSQLKPKVGWSELVVKLLEKNSLLRSNTSYPYERGLL